MLPAAYSFPMTVAPRVLCYSYGAERIGDSSRDHPVRRHRGMRKFAFPNLAPNSPEYYALPDDVLQSTIRELDKERFQFYLVFL